MIKYIYKVKRNGEIAMEERRELIVNILNKYGCATSREIMNLLLRDCEVKLTAAQISGVLRPMVAKGLAASSKDAYNTTVYWLKA